jgi:hypothetical protein
MQGLSDYDVNFIRRARRCREGARLLRSAAEKMNPAQRADLVGIAQELDELAYIIERLRFGDR